MDRQEQVETLLNVILIDDEEPALSEMEYLLKNYPEICILGKFTDPVEALEQISKRKPDVIFLDIDMPVLGGLAAARKLLKDEHKTDVVFVTAYEQYALEAFQVEAVDYLLKPISKERLNQTIERLLRRRKAEAHETKDSLVISCMGGLQVGRKGKPSMKWRTEKERELFAFLLQNNGIEMTRDQIVDNLWREDETDRAIHQLHNSIYYLKKSLKEYGIGTNEISISKHYCLLLGSVAFDIAQIEEKAKNLNEMSSIGELEALYGLFKGSYLQLEGWAWAECNREMLSRLEMAILKRLSKLYTAQGLFQNAESALLSAYNINPFEEDITLMLMELYKANEEKAKAVKHYLEYQELLRQELKIGPNKSIESVYLSL